MAKRHPPGLGSCQVKNKTQRKTGEVSGID